MTSPVIKRSVVIEGHKTSVSLEDAFWQGLKDIAAARRTTLSELIASIQHAREHGNLSSAIRLFVLEHYKGQPVSEPKWKAVEPGQMNVVHQTANGDFRPPSRPPS